MPINFKLTVDITDRLAAILERLFPKPKLDYRINFMITIPDDTPDGVISAAFSGATDAEGSVVPGSETAYVWLDPTSDNESAFAFQDIVNNGADFSTGYHVGSPNADGSPALANINFALASAADGTVVLNKAYVVQVTAGAPVNFNANVDLGTLVDA